MSVLRGTFRFSLVIAAMAVLASPALAKNVPTPSGDAPPG
jgi:hypothetical protein